MGVPCGEPLTPVLPAELGPLQVYPDGVWLKREDFWMRDVATGARARALHTMAFDTEAAGLLLGVLDCPVPNLLIVQAARVAVALGIPCRILVPSGRFHEALVEAERWGAEVVQFRRGTLRNFLRSKLKHEAEQRPGWLSVFDDFHPAYIEQVEYQVQNLPEQFECLWVRVHTGATLAAVLRGIRRHWRDGPRPCVLGVRSPALEFDYSRVLDRFYPWWSEVCEVRTGEPEPELGDVVWEAESSYDSVHPPIPLAMAEVHGGRWIRC